MWEEKQTCSWCFGKGVVYGGTVCSSCNGHGYTIIRHSDSSSGGSSSRSGGGRTNYNGYGEMTDRRGHYEGKLVKGKPHGYGKMNYEDGTIYEGDWVDDERQGKGKQTYADGRIFEGEFDENCKAKGKMTYPNGKTETGILDMVYDKFTAN